MIHFPPRSPLKLVVLISGAGTTLKNLVEQIVAGRLDARIELVVSSSGEARGLDFARQAGIPTEVIEPERFASSEAFGSAVFGACRAVEPDVVAMAGFVKFVPVPADFELRVLNIHPALIPAFCGRGFYGPRVHEAVLEYGVKLSGCTVHFVDNQYDHGPIILQRAVPVAGDDTAESLAARVFEAECQAYPEALRLLASGRLCVDGRRVLVK
ncbi:MAG: phosphoribosylglycinamide formyltransferase [Pirellulales bacterium]